MKIKIEFDDTNDDGHFEMEKAQRCMRVDEAYSKLWDVDQKLRARWKYVDSITDDESKFIEDIRDVINEGGLLELYT